MLLAKIADIGSNPVAFTFFIGCMAMFASSVFFVERGSVDKKWKPSLLVSALITGIAAVHYLVHEIISWQQVITQLHTDILIGS